VKSVWPNGNEVASSLRIQRPPAGETQCRAGESF
jgi:hypothetical protein